MDAFVLQAIARELDAALRGARLEKAVQADPFTFVLTFSCGDRRTRRLLLSGDLAHPRLHLTEESPPGQPEPGDFLRSLRKHLAGCRVTRVAAGEWERVAQLSFERAGSPPGAFALLAEVMGRWSNLVLVEGRAGRVLDAMRLSTGERNPARPVERGAPYRLPPAQKKRAPGAVDEKDFLGLLAEAALKKGNQGERARWLVRTFGGLSPAVAAEIAGRAGEDPRVLWEAVAWAVGCYREGRFHPSVILSSGGSPAGLSALEAASLPPARVQAWPSMNGAAEAFYREAAGGAPLQAGRAALARTVRGHLKRTGRNLAAVEEDLRQAGEAEDCRLKGDLLLRNLDGVGEGAVNVRFEHEGAPLEIALDPRLSPSGNAQRYFRRYKKLKRLVGAGGRRRQDLAAERSFLEELLYDAEEAGGPEALAGVRQALEEGGFGKKAPSPSRRKRGRAAPPARPYRRFLSPGGWEIFVGKSALGNEALLRRVARGGDTWLHAQGLPGSHVLLRAAGEAPEEALLQAAALAAYHSRGRRDGRVRVDYLPVERLRRPRGGRPGQVIFTGQRTLLASPEEGERLSRELEAADA
ncbi:MAG: NFACT family protein [Candidatus Tectomicrobia bacterium]|uniref:NFACT family protein n=1 Tax=Tectimicrobiota bacterium TaxID=2528274 RepID=A0A933E8A8_UNCTE|nr:NFACT family protein [Candidatus Tectomicrobia bacterium]